MRGRLPTFYVPTGDGPLVDAVGAAHDEPAVAGSNQDDGGGLHGDGMVAHGARGAQKQDAAPSEESTASSERLDGGCSR